MLASDLVMEGFFHGLKGIQVLDLCLGAERFVTHGPERHIGIAA